MEVLSGLLLVLCIIGFAVTFVTSVIAYSESEPIPGTLFLISMILFAIAIGVNANYLFNHEEWNLEEKYDIEVITWWANNDIDFIDGNKSCSGEVINDSTTLVNVECDTINEYNEGPN